MPDSKRTLWDRFLHGPEFPDANKSFGGIHPAVPFNNTGFGGNMTATGQMTGSVLPSPQAGTRVDYARAVGEMEMSSAIMACVQWVQRAFPEAPACVIDRTPDGDEEIDGHDVTLLLDQPNPYMSGASVFQAMLADYNIHGNAYALKFRNGGGRVAELWWEPQRTIRPVWEASGAAFLGGYQILRNGKWYPMDTADVLHIPWARDPRNPRLGISPLRSALRAVFTDEEAEAYTAIILHNMGMPGTIISPDGDKTITPQDAQQLISYFQSRFTGDGRGSVFVATSGLRVDVPSFSPEQLNTRDLRMLSEERISALIGVPPIVAGLGAGLMRGTYSNYEQAREAAYESNLLPTYRVFGDALTRSLLHADFGGARNQFVQFNTDDVRALQADENAAATRWALLYQRGVAKRGEARVAMGLDAGPDDDQYFIQPGATPPADSTVMSIDGVPPTTAPNDPNAEQPAAQGA